MKLLSYDISRSLSVKNKVIFFFEGCLYTSDQIYHHYLHTEIHCYNYTDKRYSGYFRITRDDQIVNIYIVENEEELIALSLGMSL